MKKENDSNKNNYNDDFDVDIQACSTMDCTGLIPSLPQSDAELESYEALYPFEPPVIDEREKEERRC